MYVVDYAHNIIKATQSRYIKSMNAMNRFCTVTWRLSSQEIKVKTVVFITGLLRINDGLNFYTSPPKIEQILSMLKKGIDASSKTVKNLGLRRAREWTEELSKLHSYKGSLKKRFIDVISKIKHLSVEKKEEIWSHIQEFLNIKPGEECVTCFN